MRPLYIENLPRLQQARPLYTEFEKNLFRLQQAHLLYIENLSHLQQTDLLYTKLQKSIYRLQQTTLPQ